MSLGWVERLRRVHLRIMRSLRWRICTIRSQLAALSLASSATSVFRM